jgi:hypothetical protein
MTSLKLKQLLFHFPIHYASDSIFERKRWISFLNFRVIITKFFNEYSVLKLHAKNKIIMKYMTSKICK